MSEGKRNSSWKKQTPIKHSRPNKTAGQVFHVRLMYNLPSKESSIFRELYCHPSCSVEVGRTKQHLVPVLSSKIPCSLAGSVFQKKSYWLALILHPFFNPSLIETCRNCSIILLGLMPSLWAPNYPGCVIFPLITPAQNLLLFQSKELPLTFWDPME